MTFQVFQEDGFGNVFDENGNQPVEMDVDDVNFPLENITNYDSYMDLKPPEREVKIKDVKLEVVLGNEATSRVYTRHSNEKKYNFFALVYDQDYSVAAAAKKLSIPRRTAYNWYQKDQDTILENQININNPEETVKKKVGRHKILSDEHKAFLLQKYGDDPRATVQETMESLISQFKGLKVSKTTVYEFMTKDCALTMKKAHFEPKERNSDQSIKKRYNWAVDVRNTDMDYQSNCIFIDESAFHINLSRTMAWSQKGTRAVVVQPKTRAKTTTILGAISSHGIINIKVRIPYTESSKKRRITGEPKAKKTVGTVTGHYFNFIYDTLEVLDRHEQFKGHYLLMDNAPIHSSEQIRRLIESRGYGCVYLPPYSPELNPIEQFWSIVKSKIKREKFLEEETLNSRIVNACNQVYLEDLQGFCRYSDLKLEVCLNKEPL
jgi:transposase/transposase-like protein